MKQMQKTFFALGTVNSVSILYIEDRESQIQKVLNHIKARILMLDDMFSVFKENSEITNINKAAGKMLVEVSPETYQIIQRPLSFPKFLAEHLIFQTEVCHGFGEGRKKKIGFLIKMR